MRRVFLAHRLAGRRDARTVDENARDAMRLFGLIKRGGDGGVVRDIEREGDGAHLLRGGVRRLLVQIKNGNLRAIGGQHRGRRLAET